MGAVAGATLKEKEERRLLRGHLWAYRNEFAHLPQLEDGALVDVFSAARRFVGRGFYQAQGGIAVRLLSRHQEEIDADWLRARLDAARRLRAGLFADSQVYRWVFGESDWLPGLVVDRYGPVAVAESSCRFHAQHAETLGQGLLGVEGMRGAVLRLPGGTRRVGAVPDAWVCELEGLRVGVAAEGAQKTGLFLDQRLNRLVLRRIVPGLRVLDGHCYHGLWSLHAMQFGAASVLGVDSSVEAIACAEENGRRNGMDGRLRFLASDIEDVLRSGEQWDCIILDPPAFAKARAQTAKAEARYRALNTLALRALRPDGWLITSSCSHFLAAERFLEVLKQAAAAAGRTARLIALRGASPDHPVLLAMPETAYLKCAVLHAP